MLHAAHEGREPALVACTPPFMAEPSNIEFAVEKGLPRQCSRFSGADRFGRCRLHAEIYEPIVNYLAIAGGIVKRRECPRNQQPRGSFHAPISPRPAIRLSRKDWHSYANRAVVCLFRAQAAPRDPAPPAAWPRWGLWWWRRMSCHGRCALEWMKRAKLWSGRHGGR